ncbi:MAG: glycerophosphodiester phosphodiesterase family protein [Verrucomicrobiales bacterium]
MTRTRGDAGAFLPPSFFDTMAIMTRVKWIWTAALLLASSEATAQAEESAPRGGGKPGVGERHVLVAAHRGGYANDRGDGAPENSVANVEAAVRKGFDVYETDIRRTADDVFVIVHDDTLDRETNGTGPVEDLTLDEVKKLRKRYRDGSLSDEPVATLEELLVAGKERILFKPDLKPGTLQHFAELAALIAGLEMEDQVFLRTRARDANAIANHFAAGAPRVEVMFKVDRPKQVEAIDERFSPATIQINVAKGESLPEEKREAIRLARERGIVVESHSYGDESQWRELAEAGVRMFHTAVPGPTLEWLEANGWREASSGADALRAGLRNAEWWAVAVE